MSDYLRLIDLRDGETEETTFGTCEICMYTAPHTPSFLVFKLGDETREYETGEWDWGDYIVDLNIDNVAAFAQFLVERKIDYFPVRYELRSLIDDYCHYEDD